MSINKILFCVLYCNLYCNIFFSVHNTKSVLTGLNVINLRPKLSSKKIYLFYEIHEKNHADQFRQYKKIEESLVNLEIDFEKKSRSYINNQNRGDLKNNLKIPIFVEVPIKFNNFDDIIDNKDKKEKETSDLHKYYNVPNNSFCSNIELNDNTPEITKDICNRFKNSLIIKTENINSRLASTAINCLLKPENDPDNIPEEYSFRSSDQLLMAKDIKLRDLFYEIKNFKDKAQTVALNFLDADFGLNLNREFIALLNRSHESEQKLLNDLKNYLNELKYDINYDPDITMHNKENIENLSILELSKKLYELDKNNIHNIKDRRKSLTYDIILTISPLLELNILKRIIENKNSEKIMVITGAFHSQSIKNALLNIKSQVVEQYGQESDFSNDYYVLSDNDLDCIKDTHKANCTLI